MKSSRRTALKQSCGARRDTRRGSNGCGRGGQLTMSGIAAAMLELFNGAAQPTKRQSGKLRARVPPPLACARARPAPDQSAIHSPCSSALSGQRCCRAGSIFSRIAPAATRAPAPFWLLAAWRLHVVLGPCAGGPVLLHVAMLAVRCGCQREEGCGREALPLCAGAWHAATAELKR